MKVLYTTNFPAPYRISFFNQLCQKSDLTVAYERRKALHRNSKWISNEERQFREIYLDMKPIGTSASFGAGIIKLLAKEQFDRIIFGGYSSPSVILAMIYCSLAKKPYFIEYDGGFNKKDSPIKGALKHFLIRKASGHFFSSKETRSYLQALNIEEVKLHHYPFTSVSKSEILPAPLSESEKKNHKLKLGIRESKAVISVGQFIPRKGFDVLLRALDTVDRSVGVYIIGGEPTQEMLSLRKQFALSNVHFIPFCTKEELAEWYQACDLFVLATREDTWGLVINEAMAFGLPIISTCGCIAALELVHNGINGIIVPIDDASATSNAISTLLDRDLDYMALKSLEIVSDYTIEKMVVRHLEVLTWSN